MKKIRKIIIALSIILSGCAYAAPALMATEQFVTNAVHVAISNIEQKVGQSLTSVSNQVSQTSNYVDSAIIHERIRSEKMVAMFVLNLNYLVYYDISGDMSYSDWNGFRLICSSNNFTDLLFDINTTNASSNIDNAIVQITDSSKYDAYSLWWNIQRGSGSGELAYSSTVFVFVRTNDCHNGGIWLNDKNDDIQFCWLRLNGGPKMGDKAEEKNFRNNPNWIKTYPVWINRVPSNLGDNIYPYP